MVSASVGPEFFEGTGLSIHKRAVFVRPQALEGCNGNRQIHIVSISHNSQARWLSSLQRSYYPYLSFRTILPLVSS